MPLKQSRSYIWGNRGGRLGCFQDCCLSENNYFDQTNFTSDVCHDYIAVTYNRNCKRLSSWRALRITDRSFMGMPHQYSGSNFPVLSVNLIPVPLSNLPVHAPTTFSHYVNSPLLPSLTPSLFYSRLKTYSQTFPTIDSLPASGLTPRTITDRFFWAPGFF